MLVNVPGDEHLQCKSIGSRGVRLTHPIVRTKGVPSSSMYGIYVMLFPIAYPLPFVPFVPFVPFIAAESAADLQGVECERSITSAAEQLSRRARTETKPY